MGKRFLFVLFVTALVVGVGFFVFSPIYSLDSVYINYGLRPFDICEKQPVLWNSIKIIFIISALFNSVVISNSIYSKLFKKLATKSVPRTNSKPVRNGLSLLVGKNADNNCIFIPEKGLYQNMIITGTIGSGKTSSAMYPFTQQLIDYKKNNADEKIGMLILDVKGNYHFQVRKFCENSNRTDDFVVIELGGKYKYNPLNKPDLKASVLANRLKTILLLFSENNSESYWLDKAEQVMEQAIKLCRLYNDGYVNFSELHKLITDENYYFSQIEKLKAKFTSNEFSKENCYNLLTAITFFENEFLKLDQRTISILKSEITRITNCFISDYEVMQTFNPEKNEDNFYGLSDIINKGKIVILNMNISEYKNLSKIIAAYLKLDFQAEVLSSLARESVSRTIAFISDEYHEYVTATDADFFAQSREAKSINNVATQSC